MRNAKSTFVKIFVIMLALGIFASFLYIEIANYFRVPSITGFVTIVPVESCEQFRTCCEQTPLNGVCFRTDKNPSFEQPFQWKDLSTFNNDTTDQLHYHGSYWHFSNNDDLPAKCGFGRVGYGGYGWLFSGPNFDAGVIDRKSWTPTKYLEMSHVFSPFSATCESEITSDRYFLVSRSFIRCDDKKNCTYPSSNIFFKVSNNNGAQGADYRTDIDGKYCGFEEKFSVPATPYDAKLDKSFLFVIEPCPNYAEQTNRKFFYDLAYNKTLNVTIVLTTKDYESGVSDWIDNYYSKEFAIRQEFENFARSAKYPDKASNEEKEAYYLNFYSNWFDTYSEYQDLVNTNFKGKEVITPNFYGYYAMWKWDSFWSALSILGAVDTTSPNKNILLNHIRDWIFVWKQNTDKTTKKWPGTITKLSKPGIQNQGGWALTAWNLYKIDNDKASLCDFEPHLKADYEAYGADRGDNWLLHDASINLGRDGTDIFTGYDSIDATSWFLLNSIVMANIENECGNKELAAEYLQEFNNIKNDINKYFWSKYIDFYCSLDSKGKCHFYNDDKKSYSADPNVCWFVALNVSDSTQTTQVIDRLLKDFVDVVGLTSIPKTHACYSPSGADNSCDSGETWDGPTWAGVDNTICTWALRQQVNVYGRSDLQDELDYLNKLTLKVAQQNKFGAESYNSKGEGVGAWGSAPYGWGALVGTNPLTGFNPLSTLKFSFENILATPTISNPLDGSTVYSNSVDIAYNSIGATSYSVFADSNLVYSGSNTSFTWHGYSSGQHKITVKATNGKDEKSASIKFTYSSNSFKPAHPNLLFDKKDVPKIRDNIKDGAYKKKYDALISFANSASDWNSAWTIDQVIWTKAYYAMQLGLTYQLGENKAYGMKAKNYLLGFASFPASDWSSKSTHATTDTFWQLSLAYDFVYDLLTDSERQTLINFFYDKCVTNSALEDSNDYYYSYNSGNGYGLRQGWGMCTLAIYGEHPTDPFFDATPNNYFDKFYQSAKNYLSGYFNSSYALDGLAYQDYGLRHTLTYIAAHDRLFPNNKLFDKYKDTLCSIPKYYAFSILDNDKPVENDYIRRLDFSDVEWAYYQTKPAILAFFTKYCNDGVAKWYLDYEIEHTDNYDRYDTSQSAEDLVWYNNLDSIHPKEAYGLSWKDAHNDYAIWRNGWTLSNDLVLSFKSDDEESGHPHADDNMITLFYKHELLSDNGYRNGTGEIPAGEFYHNTLVVDDKGDMSWSDRGSYTPVQTRQLFGYAGSKKENDCLWPSKCSYQSEDFRGAFAKYFISEQYRAVEGQKPYYHLKNFSRYVVLVNASRDFIVMRDLIKSDLAHSYNINFVIPFENITSNGNDELLIQNQDANLLIKTVYSTNPYSHLLKYKKYQKTYKGQHNYEYITSNAIRVDNAKDLFMINVLIPYLDSETQPYAITNIETQTKIGLQLLDQNNNYTVLFDKDSKEDVSVIINGIQISQDIINDTKEEEINDTKETAKPTILKFGWSPPTLRTDVFWKTNDSSDSKVEYGTTKNFGAEKYISKESDSHSIRLINLSKGTTYHFKITSCNSAGCDSSELLNFTTVELKVSKYDGITSDFSSLDFDNITEMVLEKRRFGKIEFKGWINITREIDLDSYTNISSNKLFIDTSKIPELNVSAIITFYNLSLTNPRILRDGVPCPDSICKIINKTNSTITFNVTGFSEYAVEETPQENSSAPSSPPGSSGDSGGSGSSGGNSGGGSGGGFTYVCNYEWQCTNWSNCSNNFQTRKCDFIKVAQHSQNSECPTADKSPRTSQSCEFNQSSDLESTIKDAKEKHSFRVKVNIPDTYKKIKAGDILKTEISFSNFAGDKKIDLNVNYLLADAQNNSFCKEIEIINLSKDVNFTKFFKIPADLKKGTYPIIVNVSHIGGHMQSMSSFEVTGNLKSAWNKLTARVIAVNKLNSKFGLKSLLIVAIVLSSSMIIFFSAKKFGRKTEEPAPVGFSSDELELYKYVIKELSKGFAASRIKRTLLDAGWKNETVDKVISAALRR